MKTLPPLTDAFIRNGLKEGWLVPPREDTDDMVARAIWRMVAWAFSGALILLFLVFYGVRFV